MSVTNIDKLCNRVFCNVFHFLDGVRAFSLMDLNMEGKFWEHWEYTGNKSVGK